MIKEEAAKPSQMVDVTEMEMAERYANLVGTIDKKFKSKKKVLNKKTFTEYVLRIFMA